jgi:hypothetical protein
MLKAWNLQWSGVGGNYLDREGQVGAFDPTVSEQGPTSFLIREELLKEYLNSNDLTICWAVTGEKRVIPGGYGGGRLPSIRMSGAFRLIENGVDGFLARVQESDD